MLQILSEWLKKQVGRRLSASITPVLEDHMHAQLMT